MRVFSLLYMFAEKVKNDFLKHLLENHDAEYLIKVLVIRTAINNTGTARYFYKFSTYRSLLLCGGIPTRQFSVCFHAYSLTFLLFGFRG
jgi:hypothetical protein